MRRLVLWLLLSIAAFTADAYADREVPRLSRPVMDLVGVLSDQQRATLEAKLYDFEKSKGSQIAVLVVASTKPEEIEQYSIRVVEAWKVGRSKVDDGALLLVATEDRRVRIEVGYGLEGVLTDLKAKRIIDEIIVPEFRKGAVGEGIVAGVESILSVVQGENLPAPKPEPSAEDGSGLFVNMLVLGLLLSSFARLFFPVVGPFIATVATTLLSLLFLPIALVFFLFLALSLLSLFAPRGFGRVGGMRFGGGGFSSGGSFGGGFSGGGGSFGGGGASGRW
ncbi:MAG: YgcG family protein [Oligoflexia bacterium]|nr:YgcG family protein [Oligoflexia bacterium]